MLVPSVMHVLGRANWWLPARFDRILPRLNVEPDGQLPADAPAQPVGVPATAKEES